MKNKTEKKYSVTATLRLMKNKDSFVIPPDVENATTLAHVGARQIGAEIVTRQDKRGVRVFCVKVASPKGAKIPYPIQSGIAIPPSKAGRPNGSLNAPKSKAKAKAKPAAKVKAKAKAKPTKTAKKAAPKSKAKKTAKRAAKKSAAVHTPNAAE